MIIDGQADFRSLLMHHVTTHWPDAIISAYDPTTAGHLPTEFSGAGNDLILLGSELGDREGIEVVKQFSKTAGFPPIVYFGVEKEEQDASRAGVDGFFLRNGIKHDMLTVRLSDILKSRRRIASTGSLFVGDQRTGINPLIRGYRLLLSPLLGNHCRFYPSCSQYAHDAVLLHGALAGGWLGLRRLLRCHLESLLRR